MAISCNVLGIQLLKVKNRMTVCLQKGCKCISFPHDCITGWGLWLAALPSINRGSDCISGPRKDPNAKFKAQFLLNAYCFSKVEK